jgi:hypothetical protein
LVALTYDFTVGPGPRKDATILARPSWRSNSSLVDVEAGLVLGGLGSPETVGGVISNDAPDFLVAVWPVRDLWDLLCKISDYRRKEGSAQKDAKIAMIQIGNRLD